MYLEVHIKTQKDFFILHQKRKTFSEDLNLNCSYNFKN